MVIPSTLDPTLCAPGKHVALLFTQFTPYNLANGEWDDSNRNKYADIGELMNKTYLIWYKSNLNSIIGCLLD